MRDPAEEHLRRCDPCPNQCENLNAWTVSEGWALSYHRYSEA